MSKVTRIREHLAEEVERRAADENRSFANMVETLLEQALRMDAAGGARITQGGEVVGYAFPSESAQEDSHFKPDFGKKLK